MQKPPKKTHGFSLIELSIVMAVMSMMATALVPNMLAQHQEKLVEATVDAYYHIADAAQAYHTAHDTWPGFEGVSGDCQPDGSGESGLQVLADDGYIHSATLANPWQDVFTLKAVPLPIDCEDPLSLVPCDSCGLALESGNIPASAQNLLTKLLPMAECDATDTCTAEMTAGAGAGGGGGALPTGAVMMFDDVCPAGWTEVDAMKGRMPVGTGALVGSTKIYDPGVKGGTIGLRLMGSATMGTRGNVNKNDETINASYFIAKDNQAWNGSQDYNPYAFDQLNLKALQWDPAWGEGSFAETKIDSDDANQSFCDDPNFECPDDMDVGWLKGGYTNGAAASIQTNLLETIPPYYTMTFCEAP
jgi:prepilin-type N-terminal cleavage/methylation domain-containing protein